MSIKKHFESKYFSVIEEDGYYLIKEPKEVNGVVCVVVLNRGEQSEILVANLFRRAINTYVLEFPRGAIDDNEHIHQAALRELKEETGLVAKHAKIAGYFHSNTSLIASRVAVAFIEVDEAEVADYLDNGGYGTDDEVKTHGFVGLKEFMNTVRSGKITDSHTLSALLIADNLMPEIGKK